MQLTLFDPQTANSLRYQIFLQTELGQLYQSLPINALASLLPEKEHNLGTPGWFTAAGKMALQFLKPYLGLSDEKLLERINTDWALQLFCGLQLKAGECLPVGKGRDQGQGYHLAHPGLCGGTFADTASPRAAFGVLAAVDEPVTHGYNGCNLL